MVPEFDMAQPAGEFRAADANFSVMAEATKNAPMRRPSH
jgi:hypothetical protein